MINITRRFHDAVLKVAGGATNLMPKVTVTVVNPTEKDIAISGPCELKDGKFIGGVRHMVRAGESEVIEYYPVGYTIYDSFYDGTGETESYYLDNCISGMDSLGTSYYGEGSNYVNVDENNTIVDPTQPASFTATLKGGR